MRRVVENPKLSFDQLGHPLARPHLSPESISNGPLLQQPGYSGALIGTQAWRRAGGGAFLQGFLAASSFPGSFHPLTHRALAHAQGTGNVLLGPALLL